jgi:hypothetical protein
VGRGGGVEVFPLPVNGTRIGKWNLSEITYFKTLNRSKLKGGKGNNFPVGTFQQAKLSQPAFTLLLLLPFYV